ncbi:Amyloid protein-binding protein 2 [Clonorchis sinensis]|uniref:Amyloid protein-binding protein 2 n=1 Tax=Clonorchis sinensis TaxID=79923 RepID=A0A8T1MNQ1_CLOSI|nr:Amyloid protein-binding protein 2 [Clonorchis sinensis]
MSQDSTTSSIVYLTKIAFNNVPQDSTFHDRLHGCFPLFSHLLPFESPLDLETFFQLNHFECRRRLHTVYGTIHTYDISRRLQSMVLQRDFSLQTLCLINLAKTAPPHMTTDLLLTLPAHLFRKLIGTMFSIFWLPMSHVLFHRHCTSESVPFDLQVVFNFLSNPYIFERMYEVCRDIQIFVISWMQHVQFSSICDPAGQVTSCSNLLNRHPDQCPLVPPHQLSLQLLSNMNELLSQASCVNQETVADVTCAALFGLKIANFLCDCSEYVHACRAVRAVHSAVKKFFSACGHHRAQLRLECEALCVMLRAMNAYNMYLDPEDQYVFQKEAPNLLKSMKQFSLLLFDPDTRLPASQLILPPCLEGYSISPVMGSSRKSSSSRSPDASFTDLSVPPRSSSTSFSPQLGPAGDAVASASPEDFILPPPVLPENCFRNASSSSSVAVSEILSDQPHPPVSAAFVLAQLANYYYAMCRYQLSYQFTLLAIEQLRACSQAGALSSAHVIIELLRIMCKICMIKRKYDLGLRIIRHALLVTRHYFGIHTLVYANLLLEYGCLMLNTDKTRKAARVYRVGLALILNSLPGVSIMAALALEAIAYAHYVLEYTSGDFSYALNCSEVVGLMLRHLNHEVSMQAASANRVKALIIEEIAIDDNDLERTKEFLCLARDLHMESLNLCERTFGLWNVQTAKHFGNLGRLYQSMQDNKEAEMMHRKAIMIKERLLGSSDFEVGLSVGHLASLYNYDMDRFKDAEQLYLRSIQISLNLFGPTYSGLEYDYRGLQRVYHELGNRTELQRYRSLFDQWQKERQKLRNTEPTESVDELEPVDSPLDEENQLDYLFQLANDYEMEFKGIFSGLGSAYESPTTSNSPRSGSCLPGSSHMPPEASRSTGY